MIKRLPAVSNEYGTAQAPTNQYLTDYYGGVLVNHHHTSIRSGYSNNPISLLNGSLTQKWRYPSGYRRFVRRYPLIDSSCVNLYGWLPTWFPPGSDYYGIILTTDVDAYWYGNNVVYDSNVRNEANTRALSKIASNKAQFGIALAESRKAYQMLASTTMSLWTAFRHAKRGEWPGVLKALGMDKRKVLSGLYPANKWLEYQYGWKPLLSDLYDAYSVVTDNVKNNALLVYGKSGGFRENQYERAFYDSSSRTVTRVQAKAEQVVVTRLTARISSKFWRDASQVGLINPLSIGWELVPFSFLIDWFMPIGNVLEALTAKAGLEFVSGSQTWITGGESRVTHDLQEWPPISHYGLTRCQVFDTTRARLYDWPLPLPYVSLNPFSTKRSANALALWRATLRGRTPDNVPEYNTRRYRGQFRKRRRNIL